MDAPAAVAVEAGHAAVVVRRTRTEVETGRLETGGPNCVECLDRLGCQSHRETTFAVRRSYLDTTQRYRLRRNHGGLSKMITLKIAATIVGAGALLLIVAPNFCADFALAIIACT